MRFNYTDEWNETNLSNCSYKLDYGLGASAVEYDGKHRYIRITDIDENTHKYINSNPVSPSFYDFEHLVKENDILFARTGASVGKTYHYDLKDGQLFYAGFLIAAHIKSSINSKFIFYNTQTSKYSNWVKIMSIRSGQPGINSEEYGMFSFRLPSKEEQDKIVECLDKIDIRINTQIKIINLYSSLINSIKEINFKKKNGKLYKLKDLLIEHKDYAIKNDTYSHVTLSKDGIYEKNERYDRDFLVKSNDKQYKITRYNDICYNPANLKFGVITINKYGDCIFSPIYVTFKVKKEFNPDYIAMYLCRSNFINKARRYEQGTVYERMAVSPDDLLKIEIILPDISKQKDIVNKINSINLKLRLEKKYLTSLQLQKRYLLNNLFI